MILHFTLNLLIYLTNIQFCPLNFVEFGFETLHVYPNPQSGKPYFDDLKNNDPFLSEYGIQDKTLTLSFGLG